MIIHGSEREDDGNTIELERMRIEEVDKFIDKINAVKATKKTGKGAGRGTKRERCNVCAGYDHRSGECTRQPRLLNNTLKDYFADKHCHACQAMGRGLM